MYKNLILFLFLLPFGCLAQLTISGGIINASDKMPVSSASVFLSNTSIGDKTNTSGAFVLNDIKPGKYQLVVSIIGFEPYSQTIIINGNTTLPPIGLTPKAIALNEVKIKFKRDPYRARNYEWFKKEFLGSSYLAGDCTIVNPDVLDFDYNEDTKVLTASSSDFLIIENAALGYNVRYLLTNFTMSNPSEVEGKVHYIGSVLFENMQGTASQLRKWSSRRQEVYEGSQMHFLRAVVNNRIEEEGFRVLRLASYTKPGDSKMLQRLVDSPLKKKDLMHPTDQFGVYSLGHGGDQLHISYSKSHHFYKARLSNLNSANNPNQTVLIFNKPQVLFDKNGGVLNPDDLSFNGTWGRNRVAELLPVDYEAPQQGEIMPDGEEAGTIAEKLKYFSTRHIAEKAYLHFDKPYYAAGDTIYFKAYVTLGAQPRLSDLSGVLHVDLINTNNRIDQSIKLQLTNGISWGDFSLPDSLPKGSYRVRAYTQWMRNDGDGAYFEQSIPVGTIGDDKIPESNTAKTTIAEAKPDLQFFPEGGKMLAGINSKIAFKAVSADGLGINVNGTVVDEENKEVTTFASVHKGMGCFNFTPLTGKTYKVKLAYADGTQVIVDLPKAEENGIALAVNNDSIPKATVKIIATKNYYQLNKNKNYSLLIYSGGLANTVDIPLDSMVVAIDILKRKLHTGIATVTLFSPTGEPLCERLLFVQNYDQLNISLNSNKESYTKREKTGLKLNVKNRAGEAAEGHFSVSVVNENIVPSDENTEHTILTDLLLTSDLKGYVEQPNYYFNNITTKTLAHLDLVMLTNGYRRFEWKQVLADDNAPLVYQPEKGLEISGIAKSLSGRPLAKGAVSLISKRDGAFMSTTTNSQGQFAFKGLDFTDTAKFILQAVDAKGGNNTKIIYNGDTSLPSVSSKPVQNEETDKSLFPYLENEKAKQQVIIKFGDVNGIRLKQVDINAIKTKNEYKTQSLLGAGNANQVVHSDKLDRINGSLSDKLLGQFHGRGTGYGLVVVDGIYMKDNYNINDLNGSDVETVEMIYGANAAIYGMRALNGVMVITTKQGKPRELKDIASFGILPIYPRGYYKAREFYAPKYDHPNLTSNRPDLRSTIYWKPEIITGADGTASFDYCNSDMPGVYKVTIEGIDDNGNLGVKVYRYTVD